MAMQKALHDLLKEKLGDEKSGDKKLLDIVSAWHETTETSTVSIEKLEKANKELTEKRDGYEATEKDLKEKVTALETSVKEKDTEIEKVKEGQLTPEERAAYLKTKETGMTPEAEAKYNSIEKKLSEFQEKLDAAEQLRAEAAEAAKQATLNEKQTALNNKIVTELGKVNINGEDAELALLLMKSKELYKLNVGDDGKFSESFTTKDENGKTFESTLPELCKDFATKHEKFVAPSGRRGSGVNHNSDNNDPPKPNPANLQEAEAEAAALLESKT